jgi:hypothetical protein
MIPLPVSGTWRFFDFVYPNGTNPVEEWYKKEAEEVRDMLDAILKENHRIDNPINWVYSKQLKGKLRGLWEFRYHCSCQYRVVGCFGPARKQATLLVGCYHKGKIYTPTNALDLAVKRAGMLTRKEAGRHERKIRMDR